MRTCCIFLFFVLNVLRADLPNLEHMKGIPLADTSGIVLGSKVIQIHGVRSAYNGSLVKKKDGYLLVFRIDNSDVYQRLPSTWVQSRDPVPMNLFKIGIVKLNDNFEQVGDCRVINCQGRNFMDPRAFRVRGTTYLMCYEFEKPGKDVWIMKINDSTLENSEPHQLITGMPLQERNWVPLISSRTEINSIPFLYTLYPNTSGFFSVDGGEVRFSQNIKKLSKTKNFASVRISSPPSWKWGPISGGSPAILVGDRYLEIFHSYIHTGKEWKRTYSMGACAFSKDPPYRLLSISPYPIFFKDIYQTSFLGRIGPLFHPKWHNRLDCVIFPAGIAEGIGKNGKKVVHVSCGENDLSTRIVTFDLEALLNSLVPVSSNSSCVMR
jgi:predicted GH43/DUF377 family glycosyl hydrolase